MFVCRTSLRPLLYAAFRVVLCYYNIIFHSSDAGRIFFATQPRRFVRYRYRYVYTYNIYIVKLCLYTRPVSRFVWNNILFTHPADKPIDSRRSVCLKACRWGVTKVDISGRSVKYMTAQLLFWAVRHSLKKYVENIAGWNLKTYFLESRRNFFLSENPVE